VRGSHSVDGLTAKQNLAVLMYSAGARDALNAFDKFIDVYNRMRRRGEELVDVGVAVRYLGVRDPQLFKDAPRSMRLRIDPLNDDSGAAR
jgi:hypothetical protein